MQHRETTGHRLFTDGSRRPIYEDVDGRQWVLDEDGERVYGVWLIPEEDPDPPVIVDARPERKP